MRNSAPGSRRHAIPRSGIVAGALSIFAVCAIQTPQPVHGQAGYYTQNGGVVWYGAQQPRGQYPAAGVYPAPGYVQHPATSQPAIQGTYLPGGYPAAANAAAANRYGGTTAWTQPGYVAQPYQQYSPYGVPLQPYGYSQQTAPTSGYGQTFVDRQRQQYLQNNAYPVYGYGYPVTGYPSYSTLPPGHPAHGHPAHGHPGQHPQQGTPQQAHPQPPNQFPQQQHSHNQLTPVQRAAQQAARNVSPKGVPVLSPAAAEFFQNLQGPNRSTYNQNRQNYSFSGQTRPSNQIPNTTWQSGSYYGQTWSNRGTHNQSTLNQNRFNYSLHNLTRPGFRGY
jgi:hypothetical protein